MSVSDIRPLLKTRLELLGYDEWEEGFDTDNIPDTIAHEKYQILMGSATSGAISQHVQVIDYDVELRITLKGDLFNQLTIDDAFVRGENIYCDIIKPAVRLGQSVKNIVINGMTVDAFSEESEDIVVLIMSFSFEINLTIK